MSRLGASLEWMSPAFTLEEALDTEPGRSVLPFGYLPFGTDLTGGGDPYFLELSQAQADPRVVRIPHEIVADHLSTFLTLSSIPKAWNAPATPPKTAPPADSATTSPNLARTERASGVADTQAQRPSNLGALAQVPGVTPFMWQPPPP